MSRLEHDITAADIMQVDLVRLDPTCTLRETIYAMTQARARYAVVEHEGAFAGLVSDRDVRFALPSRLRASNSDEPDRLLDETTVDAVCIKRPYSIGPTDPASEAARLMLQRRVGCLPVVDGEAQAIGMVTLEDFARVFIGLTTSDDETLSDTVRSLVA
jgi:acetoin utilization protein AcuB